jgi:hypothetical protein
MDALIAQIALLRTSAENITHIIEEVAAAAAVAAAVAAPVGAGLPPTHGAQGPTIATYLLPPPRLSEPQLTLGVAVPATFGNAEANAQHYMLGKDLYEPSAADRTSSMATWSAAVAAEKVLANAPARSAEKKVAKAAAKAAWAVARMQNNRISAQRKLTERYQAYHDGAAATVGNELYLIYRFYVFRTCFPGPIHLPYHLEPVGLLNPHTYNGWKRTGVDGWNRDMLDFVDASQPAPVLPRKALAWPWRCQCNWASNGFWWHCSKCRTATAFDVLLEGTDAWTRGGGAAPAPVPAPAPAPAQEEELGCDEEGECVCSVCEEVFWETREAAAVARYAAAAEPVPAGFSPSLQGGEAMVERLDPEARRMKADMDYFKEELRGGLRGCSENEVKRVEERAARLQEHWDGRWTTMPCKPLMETTPPQPAGQRVLIYHFHAFEPPADGSYRSAQPLKHLGLYNPFTRLIEPSMCTPTLPADNWPW